MVRCGIAVCALAALALSACNSEKPAVKAADKAVEACRTVVEVLNNASASKDRPVATIERIEPKGQAVVMLLGDKPKEGPTKYIDVACNFEFGREPTEKDKTFKVVSLTIEGKARKIRDLEDQMETSVEKTLTEKGLLKIAPADTKLVIPE